MAVTLNGLPLLVAHIQEPLTGRWCAEVEVDSKTDITGSVTMVIDGVTWVGAVHHGGIDAGRWIGRIVGGSGGLSLTLGAKSYRAAPLSVPLADLLRETGETLSSTATSLASAYTPQWHRLTAVAMHTAASLATSAGLSWRVLRDGTLWFGAESWPALVSAATQIHAFPDLGMVEIAPTKAPDVCPGVTWDGEHIGHVVTHVDAGSIRQELWYAPS